MGASIMVITVITLMFGLISSMGQAEQKAAPQQHVTTPSKTASLLHFGGREVCIGNPHAPLTIIMYYSLTCPHCHDYQKDELPKIQSEFIDKGLVRFVFRDFPTDAFAIKAAKIAWCHGTQQYLTFARRLLETQDKWVPKDAEKDKEADKALEEIARELGITDADCQKCLANDNVESSILRSCFEAQKTYQITAAPAFLINGKAHEDILTAENIRKILLDMNIHG